MRHWPLALLSFLALTPRPTLTTGELRLTLRDSLTGYGLAGVVRARGADGTARTMPIRSGEQLALSFPPGSQRLSATSPGYAPIETQFEVMPELPVPISIWLDPKSPPEALRPEARAAIAATGYATLHGYVTRESTGDPLDQVQLTVRGISAFTDRRGYFLLRIPVSSPQGDSLPESADLQVERPRYLTLVLKDTLLPEGDTHFILELRPGTGREERDNSHKLAMAPEVLRESQLPPEQTGLSSAPPVWKPSAIHTESLLAQVIAPPDSIRVGTSCSCTNCSGVSVMSLETYVRRGLKDEWIASWTAHSLRAGAIAYRSYGSYHVYHPLRANYDICNTACCQVNNPGTNGRTDSAVSYTTGILLQRIGEVFRAEYSAENNNFGCGGPGCSNASCLCGDGNAGSPGASWPCVTESFDAGHACSGHGRGMCQWGTQRSALQGQLWNWIENHYYNDNGNPGGLRSAFVTSPLDIADAFPDPPVVSAGDTFVANYSTVNYAELPHNQVLLGATLYSANTGYISDPANDAEVVLNPGSNDVARWFTVPDSTPPGGYDLLVALWIDVDEDFAITGADLPLVSYTFPGAVTVQ